MTTSRLSSVSRACLSAVAALALVLPCIAAIAFGQTPGGKSDAAKAKSDYLNEGVYQIVILKYLYHPSIPTEKYIATGLLVREPNLILTTRYFDKRSEELYADPDLLDPKVNKTGTRLFVCEQEPDPVRLAAQRKENEEKGNEDQLARYKDLGKPPANKQESERIKKDRDSALASKAPCVEASVKKSDILRGLVLIEAVDKLAGRVPVFNVSDPETGTVMRAFGYPTAAEYATRRSTTAERERMRFIPTITTGTVVKTTTDDKDGQIILHQAPVSDGSWGSPLVNNCGEVAGLNRTQRTAAVVKVEGQARLTGKGSGEVQVDKMVIPTSNVVAAVGGKELVTFASLNGIDLQNVNKSVCTASPVGPYSFQQNMWTVLVGGSALLLAATALVVALRRPGPVRNTVIKMFPGFARPSDAATLQRGYGDPYSGAGHRPSSDYTPEATTAAGYATRPSPAARHADPTNVMPAQNYAPQSSGGGRLVPIGGGQPVALDAGRLDGSGLTIGRDSNCDIVSDNSTVSKQHARITRTPNGKLQIEDLGSANGTWRGRSRIQREVFGTGDVVRFGSLEYRIELLGNGSGPTQLMPAVAWLLSGSDEEGHAVQWQLQPTTDASGRQVETSWIVGRNSERADRVLSHKRVSAEHAKIRFTPQRGLEICDLGSSNGTKVDGRKITDSFVAIDDARAIEFGGCTMSISKR